MNLERITKGKTGVFFSLGRQGLFRCLLSGLFFVSAFFLFCASPLSAAVTVERISGRLSVEEIDLNLQPGAISLEFGRSFFHRPESRGLFGTGWMSDWDIAFGRDDFLCL